MIHLYHGLFGSALDWQNITVGGSACITHDLYKEPLALLRSLKTHPKDILIGYSMGGRLALEIAVQNSFELRKVILVSTHPGLEPEERENRRVWESGVLLKMRTLSPLEFSAYWNALPLFQSSTLEPGMSKEFLLQSAELFERYLLSDRPNYLHLLSQKAPKIVWITGEKDKKYQELTAAKIKPLGIKTYEISSDHRVLRQHQALRKILIEEGAL